MRYFFEFFPWPWGTTRRDFLLMALAIVCPACLHLISAWLPTCLALGISEVWLPPSQSVCACVHMSARARLRLTLRPPNTPLHTSRLNAVWFREQQGGRKLRVKTFKREAPSANKNVAEGLLWIQRASTKRAFNFPTVAEPDILSAVN